MARFEVPGDPADTSESSHATNPKTPEHVEAPLAKDLGERAGEVIRHDQQERECLQEFLHDQFGFEKLNLCCDSRVRLLLKHAEGNSAIRINPDSTRQEISAEPTGILRRPGDPLVVKLLGSLQSRSEAKCTLDVKSLRGDVYYIPNSDNAIFFNRAPSRVTMKSSSGSTTIVDPWQAVTLGPASWVLSNRNDTISFILLPRRYHLLVEEQTGTAVRRSADASICEPVAKKAKGPAGSSTPTVGSKATSRLEKPTTIWTGVDLQENQLVQVTDRVTGHVEYSIRRLTNWAHKQSCSEAFKAILNDETSKPEVVIVKILAKPSVNNLNVMRAAREWSQEFGIHQSLRHPHIAELRGWDARTMSLFVGYKQSRDLGSDHWRAEDNTFRGNEIDACRILAQMSSALQYLAEQGIAHNDIKPGNILYTPTPWPATGPYPATSTGAVLIDFGHAASADKFQYGGTPWYIPAEYYEGKRGPPSDIFSLGVVMLYVMRRIPLPERWSKYPVWWLHRINDPETTKAAKAWEVEIYQQAEALSSPSIFARKDKLQRLVRAMLDHRAKSRITAPDLVKETEVLQHMADQS